LYSFINKMGFPLEHDIKITKSHQNLLPTQSVIVVHTVVQSILKIVSCFVPNLTHHFDDFFMWSGNHKFYIQFSRLLRLQSFKITLYITLHISDESA
jgi:hypothetical protein